MTIRIKRAYEKPEKEDGIRILVDRLWPRGISKEKAGIDRWLKEIAPSHELRRWYGHAREKWPEFRSRYGAELKQRPELVDELIRLSRKGTVTLLYSSKEQNFNNAVALKLFLESKMKRG